MLRSHLALTFLILPTLATAQPVDHSLRPELRPALQPTLHLAQAILRPQTRPESMTRAAPMGTQMHQASQTGLNAWITSFRPRALSQGISARTFEAAFRGISYLPEVIEKDRNQSEFTKTIWDYLDTAVSDSRVRNGREAVARHASILDQIESYYGVDKEIVAAIWGLESAYGTNRGDTDIISAMATLAFDGRRRSFFEAQLIAALQILESGDVAPRNMTGSWAGAMGHTQFMPNSYLAYAVDANGDGRRDIWSDDPTDALASTAAYLKNHGWITGMPWGVEVRLPRGFDYSQASRSITKMPSDWARLGVTDLNGRQVHDYGSASVLLPAGAEGAAFLVFRNFAVIERYNPADAYVIGVGHLADRIRGGAPIQASWPRGDRALTFTERQEMQRLLTASGFSTQGVDGKVGPNTIAAIRAYQRARDMIPDGYASLRLLQSLR